MIEQMQTRSQNDLVLEMSGDTLFEVLTATKPMKVDLVLVPRNLFQQGPVSSLVGMIHNAVLTSIHYQTAFSDPKYYNLWDLETLPAIAIAPKDLLAFNRMREIIYGSSAFPLTVQIHYNQYFVNGKYFCIATSISEVISLIRVLPKVVVTEEMIPRIPCYDCFRITSDIDDILFQKNNASKVIWDVDISNDDSFLKIIGAGASVGEIPWYPQVEGLPEHHNYAIYIPANILNVAKRDTVLFSLYSRIPGRTDNFFMTEFTVIKPKKGCKITYTMLHIRVI